MPARERSCSARTTRCASARCTQTGLTLFQVLTLEGWNDVLATQYNGSDAEYPDSWKEISEQRRPGYRQSEAQPLAAAIYFVSFILLGTMIMLNLFTGVIITSMEEAQAERAEEVREEHLKDKGFLTLARRAVPPQPAAQQHQHHRSKGWS